MSGPMAHVKICGITRHEHAEHAAALGAWAVGFNFWPGSKRRCDEAVAAGIARGVGPAGGAGGGVVEGTARGVGREVEPVGVFVNPTRGEVVRVGEGVGLMYVQLHGDEGP